MDHEYHENEVYDAVVRALEVMERQSTGPGLPDKSRETVLAGENGHLESIDIVTFIVALEEEIQERFDPFFQIPDTDTLLEADGPMRTIGHLVDYMMEVL